jgi:hypothetical protein
MSDPIAEFIIRVKKLNKSNKDMRLSYEEAIALSIALTELLYSKPTVQIEVPPVSNIIDGGIFPKKA